MRVANYGTSHYDNFSSHSITNDIASHSQYEIVQRDPNRETFSNTLSTYHRLPNGDHQMQNHEVGNMLTRVFSVAVYEGKK